MRAVCSFLIVGLYLVLWNYGATIFMVLCSDSTTATIQLSLPLFRPVGCHQLCGGAGSLFYILEPAAFSSFLSCFFYLFFYCSCDRHLGLYDVSVFDLCLYHNVLYFEYGPSLSSVVGLK